MGCVCGVYMFWFVFKSFGVIYNVYFDISYFEKYFKCYWFLIEVVIFIILRFLEGFDQCFWDLLIKVLKIKNVFCKSIDCMIKCCDGFGFKKIVCDIDSEVFYYVMYLQV